DDPREVDGIVDVEAFGDGFSNVEMRGNGFESLGSITARQGPDHAGFKAIDINQCRFSKLGKWRNRSVPHVHSRGAALPEGGKEGIAASAFEAGCKSRILRRAARCAEVDVESDLVGAQAHELVK